MKSTVVFILLCVCISALNLSNIKKYAKRQTPEDCESTRKQTVDALQELFLVGDTDMLLPEDRKQMDTHCDNVKALAQDKLDHINCLSAGSVKLVFGTLATSYIKVNEKRCSSQEWREKFLKFSNCVRRSSAPQDIHQCAYKLYNAIQYAMDTFDIDHQVPYSCCGTLKMDACLEAQLIKDCGAEIAKFAPELFWEPVRDAFIVSCPGITSLAQCNKMYPKEMLVTDSIFASNEKLSPRNFLEIGYKLHSNRGTRLPETVTVKT